MSGMVDRFGALDRVAPKPERGIDPPIGLEATEYVLLLCGLGVLAYFLGDTILKALKHTVYSLL